MTDVEDYIVAAIGLIIDKQRSFDSNAFPHAFTLEQAARDVGKAFEIELDQEYVSVGLEKLVLLELAFKYEDPYTPTFFTLEEEQILTFWNTQSGRRETPFGKAALLGAKWMRSALAGIQAGEKGSTPWRPLPNPDAFVDLSRYEADKIKLALDQIATSVESSNEIGESLGDDKQHVSNELRAGIVLVEPGRVRLTALFSVLLKPLRFLAAKFSEKAVGDLASALITELVKLMSH